MVTRLQLKGTDGRAPPGLEPAAQFDSTQGELTRSRHFKGRQVDSFFLDAMDGGAWPFSIGGVLCLFNPMNNRDLSLLNRVKYDSFLLGYFDVSVRTTMKGSEVYEALRIVSCMIQ